MEIKIPGSKFPASKGGRLTVPSMKLVMVMVGLGSDWRAS